ncbi:vesicular glutamate transporter 2-like [Planococcus citri]|uniref:vesicular glutamate transporter 2-like n=1 Tax=Planococcus citri TaxID=170843 RepID=UPI0031F95557
MAVDRAKIRFSNIPGQEDDTFLENQTNKEAGKIPQPYPLWWSKRFLILILLFLGYFFSVLVKVSVNIAIIEMTGNKTHINAENETIYKPPDFNWDSKEIGIVLSSQSCGYFFSILGGYFATKFGGSIAYGWFTMVMSLIIIMNPIILQWSFHAFIASRVLAGLFDGIGYASTAEVFSRWIPTRERSRFMAIIFTGVYISVAVSYPICGYVAYYCGWQMIFYLAGGSCFIWSVIWLIIVRNEPSEDKLISKEELSYILNETETSPRNEIIHPYKEIFKSPPVWALGVAKFTYGIGFSIIVTYLPQYVRDITKREINEVGVIASIPNFICIVMTPIVGAIIDYLQNNHNLKPSRVHKILMTFGYATGSILFVVAALGNNFILSMTCFVLIKLFLSFNFLIVQLICLYMAPRHSSILLGISASWYVISHVAVPSTVGFIVVNHKLQEWNTCFLLTAGILIVGAIVYMIFGSSELQPWAESNIEDKNTDLAKTEENQCEK